MKEYKVISYPMSLGKNDQNLQDFLNEYAIKGWQIKNIIDNYQGILVRNEN